MIEGQPDDELLNVQYPVFTRVARGTGRELVQHHHETEASKVIKPALAGLKRAGLLERAKSALGIPGARRAAGNTANEAHRWSMKHALQPGGGRTSTSTWS